jgi:hypothetical protein
MNTSYIESPCDAIEKQTWNRNDPAKIISAFEARDQTISQREFAQATGVARSTLRHWITRKNNIDADPDLIEFFESPVGTAFLHRLVTSAHVSFTKAGIASIHNVSDFLERAGLSPFVGSSYSSQRRESERLNDLIIEFGKIEDERLGQQMPEKTITTCSDETFHPETCLVAMEPVSNFILVEKYADNRETKTWNDAVEEAIDKFPVKVIQVTSDQGRSLVSHAIKGLDAHHSPDCFHVSYEIGKGTSGALMSAIKKSEKEHNQAVKQTQRMVQKKEEFDGAARCRGRRPDFEKRIEQLTQQEQQAKTILEKAQTDYETVRDAKAEIGDVYHPYDIKTGQKQDSEKVSSLLTDCFDRINTATINLTERCKNHVHKAQRVTASMVATIAFFFQLIDIYLDNLHISDADKHLMHNYLIPGHYLKLAAEKEKDVKRKRDMIQKATELLSMVDRHGGSEGKCTDSKIEDLMNAAMHCAQFFQRSSSCVEGRNAQLALRHQGIHRLSEKQLKTLTVIHNYYIERPDGSTAAERFFESKPNDLFNYLLDHMDYPMRPRNRVKLAA